jgi:hypothetical protein
MFNSNSHFAVEKFKRLNFTTPGPGMATASHYKPP